MYFFYLIFYYGETSIAVVPSDQNHFWMWTVGINNNDNNNNNKSCLRILTNRKVGKCPRIQTEAGHIYTHAHTHTQAHTQFSHFSRTCSFQAPVHFTSVRSHAALSLDFFPWSYILCCQQPASHCFCGCDHCHLFGQRMTHSCVSGRYWVSRLHRQVAGEEGSCWRLTRKPAMQIVHSVA